MDKQLFQKIPPGKRVEHLKANCDKIEEIEYSKQFSQEEINQFKSELPAKMIEVNKHDQILLEARETHKELTKEPKKNIKDYLEWIRTGRRVVSEECFKMVDVKEKRVGYYNQDGELVYERAAFPDELQRTTMQIVREGTTDN